VNLALSLLAGVLLVLVFPRFDWTWLAPVALAPLLYAGARERSWKRRFLNGWLSGVVFWFFACVWIQYVLETFGGLGQAGAWATFVLFAVLKGLYTALFAALAGRVMHKPWAIPAAAAVWVAVEYAHGKLGLAWVGLGFAWLGLGNAAIDMPLLPRLAPVTGVWGLSFALAMINAAVALAALRAPWKRFTPLGALALAPLLPALPAPAPGTESARVVQPNIAADTVFTAESLAALEDRLAALSRASPAPLIVWPEAPGPFYPDRPAFRAYVAEIARGAGADFLLGAVAFTSDGAPLNSAFLFNSRGEFVERYDKMRLVPFGEYVPDAFAWVNKISAESGDFVPGRRAVTLPVDGRALGAFICYESAFPDLVRGFTAAGAQMLVNLSNDGYFGDSAARQQHLLLVRMRAAENRRWILRATNNGITAMIDPGGRVTERLPEYEETAADMRFRYVAETTVYARFGDWFAWTCLAGAAIAAARLGRPVTRAGSPARRRP
jgi:apolipoprotein N-acyltransferase